MELAEIRALIERALQQDTTRLASVDDVLDGVERGEYQLWPGERSVIITQVQQFPKSRALCLMIAAGKMDELRAMLPPVLAYGREHGCTTAFLVGRHGWQRSFLATEGWRPTATVLETEL